MEPSKYPPDDGNSPDQDLKSTQFLFNQQQYQRSSSLGVHKDTNISTKPLPVAPSSDSVLQRFPETQQLPMLKLRFINSPPPSVFTYSRIEKEDDSPIAMELVDVLTDARVTLDLQLEIVALNADITEESLTTDNFNRNIVRSREGTLPLLIGDLTVTLKEGFGIIGEAIFTDYSTCLRGGKFRLGAKALEEGGVLGAISEAFVCKDHEGGFYRKLYPPYPDSKVWRLDNIAKNGITESLLAQAGIQTIKDLRRHLAIHSNSLPQILQGKISEKRWNAIVSHSMDCVMEESVYYIYNSRKAQGAILFFNSVYEVMKVSFDGITVLNTTDVLLTSIQQETLDMLKREAYENVDCVVAADYLDTSVALSASTNYDVVIRYRRGDVSNIDFISHVRAAFCGRGNSIHEDFDEVYGVPGRRVLILFLTSTYVPSNLLNITEHQQKEPRVVYPLLYRIPPSDSTDYERFFLPCVPERRQAALKEITQIPGYILTDKSESELVAEIVRDASKFLCSLDKVNMIGMDMKVKEILSLLCIESPDVRSIGIWGTVGIGKTAIAEEIFRRISAKYEPCVFLKDLHKEVEVKGQDAVREDFLSRVLELYPCFIRFCGITTSSLMKRIQHQKALVILDDVNDFRDVETFLGKLKYFGPGSRIIITSRNRHVFGLCKIDNVYEVKPLDLSNSLLLLECGTFQSVVSPGHSRALSLELVRFSSGNPRVLQILSKSFSVWKQLSQQIQKSSPIYIQDIFERSCCGLDDNERSIFLDIACFFQNMDKDYVAMLLDGCGFSAHVGFRSLVDKSLLTLSHNLLDMLKFIQATGRDIVRQESLLPEYCSRLWDPEDIMDVFIHDKGTSAIEGIFLDMSKLKFDANPNVFEKMCNIRLLNFYFSKVIENHGVSLPQGLEYLPNKLRLLHWEYYPLSSLPQSFDPKNLVELNLPGSCAKKLWKGKRNLENLKKMRLSYSYQLTKIPRLSSAPNLEHIDLEGCNSLVSISQSISSLNKLVLLNLKDCSKLESIPSTIDLESLEVLNISGCSKLENFPEISPNVKELYMGGTMIQEIPSSIKNLVLLEKLDLENSRHLVNLPTSICELKHLETLNLSGCTSLERVPDLSKRMIA